MILSFLTLATLSIKHWLREILQRDRGERFRRRRAGERIYVDASFHAGEHAGDRGVGGIGVWVPRRRIAIALNVQVNSSMEAETLALLAGALTAAKLEVERPVIFSDCKTAVRIAMRHIELARTPGLLRKFGRLVSLASEHRAFRELYEPMRRQRGFFEWQPREKNREADLASNIGSRLGNMGILLSGDKNRNHALNDILSLGLPDDDDGATTVHKSYHRGDTRTITLKARRAPTSRSFHREARRLIDKISAEVA